MHLPSKKRKNNGLYVFGFTLYFFRFGRNLTEAQLLHLILPWLTFRLEARIFALQTRQTKMPLIKRFNASSNLVAIL